MSPDPGLLERGPFAVIMARGESRRMGRPKGLCLVPGSKDSFITALCRLYDQAGLSVAVVTTDSGRQDYQGAIPSWVPVEWVVGPWGQDTAWSVFLAWQELGRRASQLWVHPVDLPLVRPQTIKDLKLESERNPGRIVRPVHQGRPGHPVIMPAEALAALGPLWSGQPSGGVPGPMRELLNTAVQKGLVPIPFLLPVPDEGTVRDFDQPGDLDQEDFQERRPDDGI